MTIDNPIGVGINNFEYFHPKYAKPGTAAASTMVNEHSILRTPHNLILKLYSELGYFGGSIFCHAAVRYRQ
jgi:O-antigen ligase